MQSPESKINKIFAKKSFNTVFAVFSKPSKVDVRRLENKLFNSARSFRFILQ